MIHPEHRNSILHNLLAKIAIAPNKSFITKEFLRFQKNIGSDLSFAELKPNELIRLYLLIKAKLKVFDDLPKGLLELTDKIKAIVYGSLNLSPVFRLHLQKIAGDEPFKDSCIDKFLLIFNSSTDFSLQDLFGVLGSDWESNLGRDIFDLKTNPYETIKRYFFLLNLLVVFKSGTQYSTWEKSGLNKHITDQKSLFVGFLNHSELSIQTEAFQYLDNTNIYIPIGYADSSACWLNLIAICREEKGYKLRLLTCDQQKILASTNQLNRYCPEVIWEGLTLEQISNKALWKALLEARSLNNQELNDIKPKDADQFAFVSTHLVPWITQKLGKKPVRANICLTEESWKAAADPLRDRQAQFVEKNMEIYYQIPEENAGDLLLRPTGKSLKKTITCNMLRKFVNLMALDCLPTKNSYLLYKAETRLLLLTASFGTLQKGGMIPGMRGKFLRLIEQSFAKVAAPLERLMRLDPTVEEQDAAKTLLISLLDLKHRLKSFVLAKDPIYLSGSLRLYPSTYAAHKITLGNVHFKPIEHTILDSFRLDEGEPPLPMHSRWTREIYFSIHSSLEAWYDLLLDAKHKCEPEEIMLLAHKNIFSRLPIPVGKKITEIFPDELPKEALAESLLLIKKICSLVMAEIYSQNKLVPPIVVLDMAKAYRFCIELYRLIDPAIESVTISWYGLHSFLNGRNCIHSPDLKEELKRLEESFFALSPRGVLKTSEYNAAIPLFYFCWDTFPFSYNLNRSKLGHMQLWPASADQVKTDAELAGLVNLRPEDTANYQASAGTIKWRNSLSGQCFLALEEVSFFHNTSIFATTDAYQRALNSKDYFPHSVLTTTGPEDHFKIGSTDITKGFNGWFNHIGLDTYKYVQQIKNGEAPAAHRMVVFADKRIEQIISRLPVKDIAEWRTQAETLKHLPKQSDFNAPYKLHQAAYGPSSLSLDVLLEYFETHSNLLYNLDYRCYCSAILRSANILEENGRREPLLYVRLRNFLENLFQEDIVKAKGSNLPIERMLWLSEIARYVYKTNQEALSIMEPFLKEITQALSDLEKQAEECTQVRIAPHLLAAYHLLGAYPSICEVARLHLMVGVHPPCNANETLVWQEAGDAMSFFAPQIQEAFMHADHSAKKEVWSLILESEQEAEEVMARKPTKLQLKTLAKISAHMQKMQLKKGYLEQWFNHWKKNFYRTTPWKEAAAPKLLDIVKQCLADGRNNFEFESQALLAPAKELLCYTATSVLFQSKGHTIKVDWETGRVAGSRNIKTGKGFIPVHLRKHPALVSIKKLLLLPALPAEDQDKVSLDGIQNIRLNICTGTVWLKHEDQEYRLLSEQGGDSLHLPDTLATGFSIWLDETGLGEYRGILAANDLDGKPQPAFFIDYEGCIRSLIGNRGLRLSRADHHTETEVLSRWNLDKKKLLVWLNDDNQVQEIHIPLHNGKSSFTRMIRKEEGVWQLDGLDVHLESSEEPIPAFAGHPVYLIAKNKEGQKVLLLPSITPYEMAGSSKGSYYGEPWDRILTQGTEDKIHQYKVSPAGQVEGLTVADNLLLLLWKINMGHYAAAAELARCWLEPAGRPYTREEVKFLNCFIVRGFNDSPMTGEIHPSAASLRLYAMVRISRHLQNYPSADSKVAKFAKYVIGERKDSSSTRSMILEQLLTRNQFKGQEQGTQFDELFSSYDQEAAARIPFELKSTSAVAIDLYKKYNGIPRSKKTDATLLTGSLHSKQIKPWGEEAGDGSFQEIIRDYPAVEQTKEIPIKLIYRSIIPAKLICFFDKAYSLIKEGPKDTQEQEEYSALKHAFSKLYSDEAQDICFQFYSPLTGRHKDFPARNNIFLWRLLHIADQLKTEGKELPALPIIEHKWGLVVEESKAGTKAFFNKLVRLKGQTVKQIYDEYFYWLYSKRSLRYITSEALDITPGQEFNAALNREWPLQLTACIEKWKNSNEKKIPVNKIEILLPRWPYQTPAHWKSLFFQKDGLMALQSQIKDRLFQITEDLSGRERELQMSANRLPDGSDKQLAELARQIHYVNPCTIDECIGLALIADPGKWQKRCPHSSPENLQMQTMEYLAAALETAHLKRVQKELDICLEEQEDTDRLSRLLEMAAEENRYELSTQNLPIMVCEYYSDCRLRSKPDQANLIALLTSETRQWKGSVIQAIMGSGKSRIIGPIWLQIMLAKYPSAILCVPQALLGTTLSDYQNMMWSRFKTHVRALNFCRESCTLSKLHLLAESLSVAQFEPTVFICSPRDLHALQLMLKERHQTCRDMRQRLAGHVISWSKERTFSGLKAKEDFVRSIENGDWGGALAMAPASFQAWHDSHLKLEEELQPIVAESDLLQAILHLIQNQIPLLVDEVAAIYAPRNLLSFPIGWQVPANQSAASAACTLYFEWLPEFYDKLGLLNNMQSYSSEEVRREACLAVARKAWEHYRSYLEDLPPAAQFIAYLQSDPDLGRPAANYISGLSKENSSLRKNYAQEICFLKFALTSGLEGAFSSIAHVTYGRSNQDPNLYLAIPYECSNHPKENTLFKSPWKTILMTCQFYVQGWKDCRQTAEMIYFLQGIDEASKGQEIFEAAELIWGKKFSSADPSDSQAMLELTAKLDQARLIPGQAKSARLLISRYLLACVFPTQVKLDPAQMTSTPQDIPMLAVKADAMGGTFGFENTWNPKLQRFPDTSCNASIDAALREPRNQACCILPRGGAEAFFSEAQKNSRFLNGCMALIDAGAHFKGMSNKEVAKRLLHSLANFDCVLFWEEENARLAILSKAGATTLEQSDKEGVRRTLSQMRLKKPFAYYDQARRIGADLDLPDGKALVIFTDIVTKDDLHQSAMRCRKLLDGRHSISYGIPAEMGQDWTADKVMQTAEQQQERVAEKANFPAICQQLEGAARAIVDLEMRRTADSTKRDSIYLSASRLLMESQENDLVKAFGALEKMVQGKEALKSLVQSLVDSVSSVLPSKKEELENTLNGILKWHEERGSVIPDSVRSSEYQEEAIQEVDLSKDLDRMRLMEEEYERMLGARVPKKEAPWSMFSRERMLTPSPIGSYSQEIGMPAIYSLKEALAERGFKVPFPDDMMISSNLLFTFQGEANCLLTCNQKPVHRGVFIRGDKVKASSKCIKTSSTYILVTEGDARYLKDHLLDSKEKDIFLIEPSGSINQRTSSDKALPLTNLWEEGSLSDRKLLFCALVFQGAALILDRLLKEDVRKVIHVLTRGEADQIASLRILFESALDFQPDEMEHYRRSPQVRALFMGR